MLLTVVEAKGSLFVRPALLMHPKLWLETLLHYVFDDLLTRLCYTILAREFEKQFYPVMIVQFFLSGKEVLRHG